MLDRLESEILADRVSEESRRWLASCGLTVEQMQNQMDPVYTPARKIHLYHCDHRGLPLALISTEPRALLLHTSLLSPKTTRATQGVAVMNMKPRYRLQRVCDFADSGIVNLSRYRVRSIPAAGALLREEDQGREQMTLL